MFSQQLICKANIKNISAVPKLSEYPNTEQWLKVVGLPSETNKVPHNVEQLYQLNYSQTTIAILLELIFRGW